MSDSEPSQQEPQPPGPLLGGMMPGMHVQPGLPFTTGWMERSLPNGQKLIVLYVEHATGSLMLPMMPEHAEQMCDKGATLARVMQGKGPGTIIAATLSDIPKTNGTGGR